MTDLYSVLADCSENKVPMGQIRGGEINDMVNEGTPCTITSWGAEMAYVIPEKLMRELIKHYDKT